ncbi:hypothetical protein EON81_09900 [bacterium]|nr:MAG: hypothetical protein EON81_09900 [bacterium]
MTLRSSLAAAAVALLAGCAASPEQMLAGNYIVDVNRIELPPVAVGDAAKTFKQAVGTTTLKLRADKTFLLAGGLPAAGGTTEGAWAIEGESIKLVPKGSPKFKGAPKEFVLTTNQAKTELVLAQSTPFGSIKIVLIKNGT